MTAAVEMGQVDSIEAVGLTTIPRLPRDQGRGDYLAVEAVIGENPVEEEAGPTFMRSP